jgi:hypothetical protein
MDNIQQNDVNGQRQSPLRHYLILRSSLNDTDESKPRDDEATTGKSEGSTECRPSRAASRWSACSYFRPEYTSKSRSIRSVRSRKSTSKRHDAKTHKNHKTVKVEGYCRCGAKIMVPYYDDRCEDCFAEDSARWTGRDVRVVLLW